MVDIVFLACCSTRVRTFVHKLECLSAMLSPTSSMLIDSLKKHEEKEYHKEAVVKMDTFMRVMSGQQDSVSIQINNAAKELVARNRKKLQSIIETIILCG